MNMLMNNEAIKLIQQQLNSKFGEKLATDGAFGPKTNSAILRLSVISSDWSNNRRVIGAVQYLATLEEINAGPIDGLWGPQTEYAYYQWKEKVTTGSLPAPWRDDEWVGVVTDPGDRWPAQSVAEMEKFYGKVGENQTRIVVPYPLKLAWEPSTTIRQFYCHEKVADSISRVLSRVVDHYGMDEIRRLRLDCWGGCLNVRKMRGGSNWSTHAWGVSIDWDPENNRLRWGEDKALLAHPEYDMWWQLWEEERWVSLGRTKNRDFMHVQAVRVK
jgi:hypothetical protein